MPARVLSFAAGFFVYVAVLLCFVQVPPHLSKPLLAGGFAAVGVICALAALALARFIRWRRTLGAILVGASLISGLAVGAIAVLRASTAMSQAAHVEQLGGFTDYRTGGIVAVATLVIGVLLLMTSGSPDPK
jgi:hypothetical protein